MIFKENNKAIYLQIFDGICDRILSGEYTPGERIPSVRDYAAQMQVNPNTMMRSYEMLSQRQVIYNMRGMGYFLADDAMDIIRRMRQERFFNGEIQDFFHQLSLLEVTPDELKSQYKKYLEEIKK